MEPTADIPGEGETVSSAGASVTLRYWAAAKAAAGVAEDTVPVSGSTTLADLRDRAVALHPGTRLEAVLGVCSVLVGDRPVGSQDPGSVQVSPGDTVEFLPPFAGG
jgi:molybdopterin synthase sulfur carrier subunit